MTGYDVIGDVHGDADALTALLCKLGYRERGGAWQHAERTAVFVGDLVDRGPGQIESIGMAHRMVEVGADEHVAAEKGSAVDDAIEVVLKGPEIEMDGMVYLDKDGYPRRRARFHWWSPDATTLRGAEPTLDSSNPVAVNPTHG